MADEAPDDEVVLGLKLDSVLFQDDVVLLSSLLVVMGLELDAVSVDVG